MFSTFLFILSCILLQQVRVSESWTQDRIKPIRFRLSNGYVGTHYLESSHQGAASIICEAPALEPVHYTIKIIYPMRGTPEWNKLRKAGSRLLYQAPQDIMLSCKAQLQYNSNITVSAVLLLKGFQQMRLYDVSNPLALRPHIGVPLVKNSEHESSESHQAWTTLCADIFFKQSLYNGKVLCHQMGFNNVEHISRSNRTAGILSRIHINSKYTSLMCTGDETNLLSCSTGNETSRCENGLAKVHCSRNQYLHPQRAPLPSNMSDFNVDIKVIGYGREIVAGEEFSVICEINFLLPRLQEPSLYHMNMDGVHVEKTIKSSFSNIHHMKIHGMMVSITLHYKHKSVIGTSADQFRCEAQDLLGEKHSSQVIQVKYTSPRTDVLSKSIPNVNSSLLYCHSNLITNDTKYQWSVRGKEKHIILNGNKNKPERLEIYWMKDREVLLNGELICCTSEHSFPDMNKTMSYTDCRQLHRDIGIPKKYLEHKLTTSPPVPPTVSASPQPPNNHSLTTSPQVPSTVSSSPQPPRNYTTVVFEPLNRVGNFGELQYFIVNSSGCYLLELIGASGGNSYHRFKSGGASVKTVIDVTSGQSLTIVVGQIGGNGNGGGGGGGSFVYENDHLYAAAGGGGGAGRQHRGKHGNEGECGGYGGCRTSPVKPGCAGHGAYSWGSTYYTGGSGAGWFSPGNDTEGLSGGSREEEWIGGSGHGYSGGYGGGGAGYGSAGGGGGGYSGGAPGDYTDTCLGIYRSYGGGGGGSYCNPENIFCVKQGGNEAMLLEPGEVKITGPLANCEL